MSLFLSEWLDGPEQFIDFANIAWDPKIYCKLSETASNSVSIHVSLFNVNMMMELTDALGDGIGKVFLERLDAASVFLLSSLGAKKFVEYNLNPIYKESGMDIELTSDVLSKLFSMMILDFEFWYKIDIIDIMANLIFYGTILDPKPLVFVIQPMSEWDESDDGWMELE